MIGPLVVLPVRLLQEAVPENPLAELPELPPGLLDTKPAIDWLTPSAKINFSRSSMLVLPLAEIYTQHNVKIKLKPATGNANLILCFTGESPLRKRWEWCKNKTEIPSFHLPWSSCSLWFFHFQHFAIKCWDRAYLTKNISVLVLYPSPTLKKKNLLCPYNIMSTGIGNKKKCVKLLFFIRFFYIMLQDVHKANSGTGVTLDFMPS